MDNFLHWLNINASWLFSGIGMLMIIFLSNLISSISRKTKEQYEKRIRKADYEENASDRLSDLLSDLMIFSKRIDTTIGFISSDLQKRESALRDLKERNDLLSKEEEELEKRVKTLKDIPIEVAEYFQQINQSHLSEVEKKGSRRDIIIFTLGIFVTTVVSIIVTLLFQ